MEGKLQPSEWVLVGGIFVFMASLFLIAKINVYRSSSFLEVHPAVSHVSCVVMVEGAVKNPGTFKVAPGTPLKKILRKCIPLPFADLKKINLEQRVESSMVLYIEKLLEIQVYIDGLSPERLELVVPAGSKVSDLKSRVVCNEELKKRMFKSCRILKDQEVLSVKKEGACGKCELSLISLTNINKFVLMDDFYVCHP